MTSVNSFSSSVSMNSGDVSDHPISYDDFLVWLNASRARVHHLPLIFEQHALIRELNFLVFYHYSNYIPLLIEQTLNQTFTRFQGKGVLRESCENAEDLLTNLQELHWHIIYEKLFLQTIRSLVENKISVLCDEQQEDVGEDEDEAGHEDGNSSAFLRLQYWFNNPMKEFVQNTFSPHQKKNGATLPINSNCANYYTQLIQVSIESFVSIRSKKLFDMITDYPDSVSSLLELKECVGYHSSYLTIIGKELRNILNKRLLHLGASTSQILDFYVSMIKSLRLIDGSDVLLNYVATPVRQYLKLRKDTIRCILSSLTESKDSDLHDELKQGSSLVYGIVDEDDEKGGPGESWQPSARYKELKNPAMSSKGLDILATLVSIYGSTELFIVEYRNLLSEKMLASLNYQTDIEVANLELLKIRFGEESLHHCEVMLKDIEDSKRTNTAVHSALRAKAGNLLDSHSAQALSTVDHVIISDNYWPAVASDHLNYHPYIQKYLKQYHDTYLVLKKPRKLQVLENLGYCDLDLSFLDGSKRTFSVNPIQANVIFYIGRINEENGESSSSSSPVTFQDLLSDMELEESDIIPALKFWISKGVIRECSGAVLTQDQAFEIIEEQADLAALDEAHRLEQQNSLHSAASFNSQHFQISSFSLDNDSYAQMQNQDAQRQKMAIKLVEDYVKSLLKGHGSLTIDRLFTSLQLLLQAAMTENTTLTTKDFPFANQIMSLKQFLQTLNDVDCLEGVYSLRAPINR